MTACFAAMFLGTFNAAVNPPVVSVKPERLAELIKKLEEPTIKLKHPISGEIRLSCLTIEEQQEISQGDSKVIAPLIEVFEDSSKSPEARAEAVGILTKKLRGYFVKPDKSVLQCILKANVDHEIPVRLRSFDVSTNGRTVLTQNHDECSMLKYVISDEAVGVLSPAFVRSLADKNSEVVSSAAFALYSFGKANIGIPELLKCMDLKNDEVRSNVILALSEIGRDDPRSLPLVVKHLMLDDYPLSSNTAIKKIGKFGELAKEACPVLIKVIENEIDSNNKIAAPQLYRVLSAVDSLGQIGPSSKNSIPLLLKMLKMPDIGQSTSRIRLAIIRIDAKLGNEVQIEYLKRIAENARKE
jgi:HEAT repeat protein